MEWNIKQGKGPYQRLTHIRSKYKKVQILTRLIKIGRNNY